MIFNSFEFVIFLPVVFALYWFIFNKTILIQNSFILLASYVFYGWWDYRFLGLILLSTVFDFFAGKALESHSDQFIKKMILCLSVLFNLSLLMVFKYYNFFIDSWVDLWSSIGYSVSNKWSLEVVLPVGISFYTFQTMSYTIDVYREKLRATNNFITFSAFVSFFPQLVAGPIERASNLLPQIQRKRVFSYVQASDGVKLILWGMFKKVVIADSLAPNVDYIFTNFAALSSGELLLGAIYFSFQIYGDFSGYSDIAIGTAKLFGFEIISNFKFPYFSRNIGEFWQRWHISLSSWFKDYLYIPIGGSKVGRLKTIRNIFIVFLVSGFWHGANWTFIAWGSIHALLYIPLYVSKRNKKYTNSVLAHDKTQPSITEIGKILVTFFIVTMAWIFFRSDSIGHSMRYFYHMLNNPLTTLRYTSELWYIAILLFFEWRIRANERDINLSIYKWKRYVIYMIMTITIYYRLFSSEVDFIYFQF